jgi:putative tryptophan/tyrosine transport system substrate-binding protein
MPTPIARRSLITLLGGAAAAWPLSVRAQERGAVRRIGLLIFGREYDPNPKLWATVFEGELQKLGWFDDRNMHIDFRLARDSSSVQASAKELVGLTPDLIVVHSSPGLGAVQQQTKTIPLVFVAVGDPVANGFVKSIATPEGNTTGFTNLFPSIGGKWLELLKQAAPHIEHVGLLFNPDLLFGESYIVTIEASASSFGVPVIRMPYRNVTELQSAAAAVAAKPNGGIILVPPVSDYPTEFIHQMQRDQLASISNAKSFVIDGGLMSYGADNSDLFRRAASYVDRILHGEKVSNLPVQFPTKFEMALNMKTAKVMGLNIPETLRALATDVIE